MFDILLYPSESGVIEIKTLQKDGITLFHLADVVKIITKESQVIDGSTYSDQTSLLKESMSVLDEDERHIEYYGDNVGRNAEFDYFVTEPGIYRVVSRAKSSGAKKFQRWVYHDVMPALRKFGVYPPPKETNDSFLLQIADQQAKQSQLLSQYIRQAETRFNELDEKCDSNDKSIKKLAERVIRVETANIPKLEFYDVADVLSSMSISENDLIYVIALCEKICAEKNHHYIPSLNGIREEQRFTMPVIELALNYARIAGE